MAALMTGASASAQTPPGCENAYRDPEQSIQVNPGDAFAVELETNAGTGYRWSLAEDPDPAVIAPAGSEIVRGSGLPGAPQRECFYFAAAGPGSTGLDFVYTRPFEPDAPPAQAQHYAVFVSSTTVPVQVPLVPLD